ncbi:MAG: DEAD/DEAH box helicase family protein [Chloroflexi bacterium]|nr:DEAD/DEAH box helicase family protein [Chloroflexota bacterium]
MTTSPLFQIGDRFELYPAPGDLRHGVLPLEPALSSVFAQREIVITSNDAADVARIAYDSERNALQSPQLRHLESQPGLLVLECAGTDPYRFRLMVEPPPAVQLPVAPSGAPVTYSADDSQFLYADRRTMAHWNNFRLSLQAEHLGMVAGFDQLLCLPWLRDVELLDHQLRSARTVLRRLRGRALLCDEVGLGKTIEAGIVMLELIVRGLARRVLILTPPSLVEQWQGELRRKFGQDFVAYDDPAFRAGGPGAWAAHDRIVASYHTAKREPHRSAILAQDWDLLIVDEAHHFRKRRTLLWQMAAELRRKYVLLLTATPVQNDLDELFNLVTLLQPGLLSTARSFQRQYVDRRDKLMPRNVEQLHQLLAEVMVRNRRSTVGIALTRRTARTRLVTFGERERALYVAVSQFVRRHLAAADSRRVITRIALVTLQKELGSSSQAAVPTLERLALDERLSDGDRQELHALAALARETGDSAKADALLALLNEFPDKMVVFTQFRATQAWLAARLAQAGERVAVFHGGLKRLEKEAAIRAFEGEARILLSTDAGSEGRNLQFCHAICNVDLPWNPMKIEQRVGRLSRIGQRSEVQVFNLAAADTLEAAVLHLLEAKIAMFELVIGEIDMILGNLDEDKEFEDVVTDLWAESRDTVEFQGALDRLGDQLLAAKDAYLRQRAQEDRLFGERFAPDG